ncbi:MAG: PEP-CTERM sorting domain-containing protein [Gemmatimonadaceae bacterium]|jgi:hypothetical protein|nr:PEP-CTERM sorting domain-containing protein [Gemmatimonadaceae bacterium]
MQPRFLSSVARVAAAVALVATTTQAQVVYSGTLNRAIPNNGTGLFVNVVTGTFFDGPGVFPTCPGPGCGYDFNLFGSSSWSFFNPGTSGQPAPTPVPLDAKGIVASSTGGPATALLAGTLIGSSSVFNTNAIVNPGDIVAGADRIFGFRFRNEAGGNSVHFGWARVRLTNGQPGVLVDYAFNATALASIAAGDVGTNVVPEPATIVLTAAGLGMLGVARLRRRAA